MAEFNSKSFLSFLLDLAVIPHDYSSLAEEFGMLGRSIYIGLLLFSKISYKIEVFSSIFFAAHAGSCRQWSRAVTCLQPGMLTDVKEGACAGLSCLVWPIIAHQPRLLVLLKSDQRAW